MKLFNYSKPGPGVKKDAPSQKRFFIFWEVLFRKFFDLCKLNLLFMIPVVVIAAVCFGLAYLGVNVWVVVLLPTILLGPCMMGITFVTRNYAREEHAFIYSDFMDAIKNNWKQSLPYGIITYVYIMLMVVAFPFYWQQAQTNAFFYLPLGICTTVSIVFLFMQYYIPVMIVTFDLKLKAIYKNALILAIVGLGRNLMLTLFLAITFAVMLLLVFANNAITFLIASILFIFLFFAFVSFLINFMVYPNVDRYIIRPFYEKQEESKERTTDIEKSEYVYVDGRLVKREIAEKDSLFDDDSMFH